MDVSALSGYLLKPKFLTHTSYPGHYENRDNVEVEDLTETQIAELEAKIRDKKDLYV